MSGEERPTAEPGPSVPGPGVNLLLVVIKVVALVWVSPASLYPVGSGSSSSSSRLYQHPYCSPLAALSA